jgi:hypothetical protein
MCTIQNIGLKEEESEDKDVCKHVASAANSSIRPGLLLE